MDNEPEPAPHVRGILLTVAYDGTNFHGFAPQQSQRTVYSILLDAIRELDPSVEELRGASRTDAGVHAKGQLVAFDCVKTIPPKGWVLAVNSRLPADVVIVRAQRVPAAFNPRFHAAGKHYRYSIFSSDIRHPFFERMAWRIDQIPNIELMKEAANALLGEHDFRAFRTSSDQRTQTHRTLTRADVRRVASSSPFVPEHVTLDVEGSGFMHNMVRIIAGTLVDIGLRRKAVSCIEEALHCGERNRLGMTAPAHGLCLLEARLQPLDESETWP